MKNFYYNLRKQGLLWILSLTVSGVMAQNVTLPRPSQQSTISQRVGISDVTIVYHSPGVKGRKVFGALIAYDNFWRAGANENTTITLTHDAKIEGENIKAGTYGLFAIPGEKQTQIVLSKYSQSWGTVYPTEDETVLKVAVDNQKIPFQEWLSYDFIDRGGNDVTAVLNWEETQIPFKISFDVPKIVVENAQAELKGPAGFGWQGKMQIARFCLQNDVNLDQAMVWVDESINNNKNFNNLQVKAGLLQKQGKTDEGLKLMEEAVPLANAFQLNNYGYQLLGLNKTKEAIDVFSMNIKKNPDHQFIWGFLDSLGEAYLKDGNKKLALKYYKEAKTKAPENQYAYLDGVISNIENQ